MRQNVGGMILFRKKVVCFRVINKKPAFECGNLHYRHTQIVYGIKQFEAKEQLLLGPECASRWLELKQRV